MNREDIIRMAREAEFPAANYPALVSDNDWEALERFAELVRKDYSFTHAQLWLKRFDDAVRAEREACAKVAAKTVCDIHLPTGIKIYGTRVAAAIRARGNA